MSVRSPPLPELTTQPRIPPAVAQPPAPARPVSAVTVQAPGGATNNAQARVPETRSAFQRAKLWVKGLLGYAGSRRAQRDRREVVGLILFLIYSVPQIIVILTLTTLGATTTSPVPVPDTTPPVPQSELAACSLLGAWNLIWLGRTIVRCYLEVWLFRYKRQLRRARRAARQRASRADLPPLAFQQGEQQVGPQGGNGAAAEEPAPAPICPLTWTSIRYGLYKADPFFTIVWFFTTVLVSWEHGSRCRDAAKDISAITYTLLLMVYVQYVFTTLIPTIRLIQARRRANRPVVGKLSKKDVDRIPLVLYIPPPPGDTPASPISPLPRSVTYPIPSPRPPPPSSLKRRRFIPFRPSLKGHDTKADLADLENGEGLMSPIDEELDEWERSWERGSYPFVRLPENRATCMICLSEFEAPMRVSEGARQPVSEGGGLEMRPLSATLEGGPVEELRVESPRDADARAIQLADGGSSDAPQPLRLLSCGHAYHKDCVDPWLTQKSGRCPYCSARVEIPPAPGRRDSIWRRGTV
ncbi:hypothetical protein BD309DRAFT_988478 [Dichomitus squalens]|nr:hypothetical protein BD309DRAFT_988478 [Dichomitus squalens]